MEQFIEFTNNHPVLSGALLIILILIIINEIYTSLRAGKKLPLSEAIRLINDNDAFILDVRKPADYKKGHLINAKNIPLDKINESGDKLPRDKSATIICYDMLGSGAATASERLKQMGYESVFALAGGMNAWQTANLPLTTK